MWFGCHLGGYWWCTPRTCKSFYCVQECSFAVVLQHLHCVVNGVEGVIMFNEMLGKFGSVAVGSKGVFYSLNHTVKLLSV